MILKNEKFLIHYSAKKYLIIIIWNSGLSSLIMHFKNLIISQNKIFIFDLTLCDKIVFSYTVYSFFDQSGIKSSL
jgi:hypothetical protein